MRRIHCNNAQRVKPFCIFRFFFIFFCIQHSFFGIPQIREVYTFAENPDDIYFVEEVPLPSTLQEFNAISIFQDKDGFMWFGGENGLLRYDGSRIREYFFDPNLDKSVRLSNINSILQDSSGLIWLGTLSGLISLDPSSNMFRRYPNPGLEDKLWEWNCINEMILDDQQLWLAAQSGFCRFDLQTHKFDRHIRLFNRVVSGEDNYTMSVSKYTENELFIRFGAQLFIYNISADSVNQVPGSPPSHAKPLIDLNGNIVCPSWSGLYRYIEMSGTFEKINVYIDTSSTSPGCVRSLLQDEEGCFWICSDRGIGRFSENWQSEKYWKFDFEMLLADNYQNQLRGMYMDRNGIIWFSTPDKISRIIRKPRVFHHDNQKPLGDYIIHLSVNDSSIWYANALGLFSIHHDRSGFRKYHIESKNEQQVVKPFISFIHFDRGGNLWLGTKNTGIYRCTNVSSEMPIFQHIFPGTGNDQDIRGKHVVNMYEDNKNRLWFGMAFNWPSYYDPETSRLVNIIFKSSDQYLAPEVKVEGELGNGFYLASTREGAAIFSLPPVSSIKDTIYVEDYEFYPIRNKGNSRTNFPSHMLISRHNKPLIYVYVVSDKGGIQRYIFNVGDKVGEKLTKDMEITTNDGLIVNRLNGIVEDRNGIIYFSSENGMVRLNPGNGSFTTYTRKQGLGFDEFASRSVDTGPDGRIYFGTDFGLVSFHPDNIVLNTVRPPVLITDVKANGISIMNDSLASVSFFNKERFNLNYKQNNLTFEFAALNYIHPERNHFKIQLKGFDDQWIPVGSKSSHSYYNINPGKYSFQVIGSNNDDVWNMTGDRFTFVIKKPPWFTWGALFIYLVILSVMVFISYRFILYRAQNRMEIEKERIEKQSIAEVDEMKSRFFTNISHEFRTPLTLIMGHVRDLEGQPGSEVRIKRPALEVLGRNARRLLLLINQLLDIAKLEKNALELDLKKGDLSDWTRVLVSSFQSLADSQEIQFSTQIVDADKEVCFDPDKTEKIITNLLSNAFKFTGKGGRVGLSLKYLTKPGTDQKYAEIEISDSGKGMDEEEVSRIFDRFYQASSNDTRIEEGSGIGLSLTKELVELLKGTIAVESATGKGTTFRVRFPVSEECFPGEDMQYSDTPGTIQTKELVGNEQPKQNSEEKRVLNHEHVVLVVEDNPDLKKYLVDQLEAFYQVLEAEDGRKGLEIAKQSLPDLVITDLMMPVMSGLEMMEVLKQDPATNHIPVIMLTAKADMQSKLEGLETGADDYIIKPFDSEELRVRVRNLIRQRAQLREKFAHDFLLASESDEGTLHYNTLRGILDIIHRHLEDAEFNMSAFCRELGMTRSQLFRKIRSVTNTTPNELIRIVRMKRAARLLRSTELNVTQVMYEVGMKNPSHFAKSFKKYYKVNPAKYRKHK